MNIIKSIVFGALIGFSATLLHNLYSPYGYVASLILTFLGIRVIGQTLFKIGYQLIAALAWLAVGLPLAYGIWVTLQKSAVLFK